MTLDNYRLVNKRTQAEHKSDFQKLHDYQLININK